MTYRKESNNNHQSGYMHATDHIKILLSDYLKLSTSLETSTKDASMIIVLDHSRLK